MTYCVNPKCVNPENPETEIICRACQSKLLLKERYRPLKAIGQGGFGKTFLGVDQDIPYLPKCVIKQLYFPRTDPETYRKVVQLFRQEAIRLHQLSKNSQIPKLLGYFQQEQQFYLVQEFIEGQTLGEELHKQGLYRENQVWELLRGILPVLQFIHSHQVIHRDIKPANLMRRGSGELILIDFGVAKLFTNTNLWQTGTIIGSPHYMAPEQMRGKAIPASDLYSLGVTCIYLLTGTNPSEMFDVVEEKWLWRDYLPSGVQVSDRLGQILDKLLQSSIKERYQSAEEVLAVINLESNPSKTPAIIRQFAKDELASDVGVNYSKLWELLSIEKWKQADQETWVVMCQAIGKSPGRYIFITDIAKFPLQDLWTIDQLWRKYSFKRFSFSVQTEIYQSVEREYDRFCDRVGWTVHKPHIPDAYLQFSLKAPVGHLPSRRWLGDSQWWRHAEAMAVKLDEISS